MARIRWVFAFSVLAAPAVARAQADVRLIRPDVMLLLDTSGSMEWMPGQDGVAPVCNPGNALLRNDRNRWNVAVEVLTGTFESYTCQEQPRSDPARLDYNYYIPHYQARWTVQDTDGVLDEYRERVKFGLLTFDSYAGSPHFPLGRDTDADGMWSYGTDARLFCADCAANYTWNAGGRNEAADEGALVSCRAAVA